MHTEGGTDTIRHFLLDVRGGRGGGVACLARPTLSALLGAFMLLGACYGGA